MRAIVFHPEAKADLIGAMAYYDGKREGLGDKLLAEVELAAALLADRLAAGASGYRKAHVARFPYTLHFAVFNEEIWIMAVAHHRRHPDYWKQREPG